MPSAGTGTDGTWRVSVNGFETEDCRLRESREKEEQEERTIEGLEQEVHDDSANNRGSHAERDHDVKQHINIKTDKDTIEAFLEDFESEAATMTTTAKAAAATISTSLTSEPVSTAGQAIALVSVLDCSSSYGGGSKQGVYAAPNVSMVNTAPTESTTDHRTR
jgi:hypothetical protein